jgi:hypothetical protein
MTILAEHAWVFAVSIATHAALQKDKGRSRGSGLFVLSLSESDQRE